MFCQKIFPPPVAFWLAVWLLSFSTLGAQERKIQPGDAIEIVVHDHDKLNQIVVVSAEGKVDFPFMPGMPVDDMSLQRFQELLVAHYARYTDNTPLVTARFTEHYPIQVTILGQVGKPGLHSILNTSTLQGAIAQAGGFLPGAQLSNVKLIRSEGGEQKERAVDLEKFYKVGDLTALPALKDDDTIVVPGNPLAAAVKVFGAVQRPGSYELPFRSSLVDVIFMAGGPAHEANLSAVKLISHNGQTPQEIRVNLKNLLLNSKNNSDAVPSVMPGDVVYVPQRPMLLKKLATLTRDLLLPAATLYVIIRYSR